jgi:antitoxin MazE
MKAQVMKWGNSLAVRIPQVIAKDVHFKEGDAVELTTTEEGHLEIRRRSPVPSLSELVARITPENRHGEISTGKSLGKESIEW